MRPGSRGTPATARAPGDRAPGNGQPRALGSQILLVRLGIKTLGDFAALPAPSVLGRFGTEGLRAHRLASGLEERPVLPRPAQPDWTVTTELDPPAGELQAAAFVGKALADELHARLAHEGLVCTRLAIEAETEHAERLRRSWRHEGPFGAGAIGERVRWQLEGWAEAGGATSGITKLTLVAEEVRPDDGRQLGFWGKGAGGAGRAARALARVQGMVGPEGALTAVLQGGRGHAEQVRLVPWGEPREPLRPGGPDVAGPPGAAPRATTPLRAQARGAPRVQQGANSKPSKPGRPRARGEVPSWPGRLPGPAPALVHRAPLAAEVTDGTGTPVSVSSRGLSSASPAWLAVEGGPPMAVETWAGPWPLEERWWDSGGRRRARFQVCTAGGGAYLVSREKGRWWVEATYD